jgi:hypothetical protein
MGFEPSNLALDVPGIGIGRFPLVADELYRLVGRVAQANVGVSPTSLNCTCSSASFCMTTADRVTRSGLINCVTATSALSMSPNTATAKMN